MQDRARAGVEWIRGLERRWDACNNFRYHLWWHLALMHLGLGEADAALALYDERVWDPASDEYLDLCNDAALLQRLELAGVNVGDRWAAVAAARIRSCSPAIAAVRPVDAKLISAWTSLNA